MSYFYGYDVLNLNISIIHSIMPINNALYFECTKDIMFF